MRKLLFFSVLFVLFISCSFDSYYYSNTYLMLSSDDVHIYDSKSNKRKIIYTIPSGRSFIVDNYKRNNKNHRVKYEKIVGYSDKIAVTSVTRIPKTVKNDIVFKDSIGYVTLYPIGNLPYGAKPSYNSKASTGGSVNVKGYHRKDGTYVKSHTRRAPRSKRR